MADIERPVSTVEDEPWFKWRLQELRNAGFPPDYAYPLALDRSVDLHKAVDIVKKCGADTAFAILH